MMETTELSTPEFDVLRICDAAMTPVLSVTNAAMAQVLSITKDGRIFWRQREVETDDDLRTAMKEVAKAMLKG